LVVGGMVMIATLLALSRAALAVDAGCDYRDGPT
jgi:hypothetical protein